LQIGGTSLVPSIFSVLTSVRFNDEHLLKANEVNDPGPNWHLASELDIRELP